MPKKQTMIELPNCPPATKSIGNISVVEQRQEAKAFTERWLGTGYEKGETQKFWLELLRKVFGIENPEAYIEFEDPVKFENKRPSTCLQTSQNPQTLYNRNLDTKNTPQ